MSRAGHLWTPKPNTTHDENMVVVFTRFFYDLIYDPTFFRDAYLAKWLRSQRKKDFDIRDAPLLLWVDVLKKDPETKKKVEDNIRIAQAEIQRMQILSSLLGTDTIAVSELEKSLLLLWSVFYSSTG